MMDCKVKILAGDIIIKDDNFKIISSDDGRLSFSDDSGWHIYIFPFTTDMVRSHDFEAIKKDIYYKFAGMNLGFFTEGPFGHPGDNERDYYTIIFFDTCIRYSAAQITILFTGKTKKGQSFFASGIPEKVRKARYQSLDFSIDLIIPEGRLLQEFLKLPDISYQRFLQYLNKC